MEDNKYNELLDNIRNRFESYKESFDGLSWEMIEAKIAHDQESLDALLWMEETKGEPSLLEYDLKTNKMVFSDFSTESPMARRSFCYDQQAYQKRKNNKPEGSVIETCKKHNVTLLNEQQYRKLQTFKKIDQKTSSWIQTPNSIRELGGALFMDCRYNTVFVYHNGAESYYSSRGFRVALVIE